VVLGQRRRQPCLLDYRKEPPLELRVGEDETASIEQLTQHACAGLARVAPKGMPKRIRVYQIALVGLNHGLLKRISGQARREVDQRPSRAGDRQSLVSRRVAGSEPRAPVDDDPGHAGPASDRNGDLDLVAFFRTDAPQPRRRPVAEHCPGRPTQDSRHPDTVARKLRATERVYPSPPGAMEAAAREPMLNCLGMKPARKQLLTGHDTVLVRCECPSAPRLVGFGPHGRRKRPEE
jgi:hypothetical protein